MCVVTSLMDTARSLLILCCCLGAGIPKEANQ